MSHFVHHHVITTALLALVLLGALLIRPLYIRRRVRRKSIGSPRTPGQFFRGFGD